MSHLTSNNEQSIEIIDLASLEGEVGATMDRGAFGYIQSGADDEWTLRENTESFYKKQIVPRVLQSVDEPDTRTSLLGIPLTSPIITSPTAANGLAHVRGEKDSAKGTGNAGSIFSISTWASQTIRDVRVAAPQTPLFVQLYMAEDDGFNKYYLTEAKHAGAKAIVLTADATIGGNREADIINNFTFSVSMPNMTEYYNKTSQISDIKKSSPSIAQVIGASKKKLTPTDIDHIKSIADLPVFLKGVQSPDDALVALQAGADGIWVSNHGGRQLDCGPASFDVLHDIARVIDKKVPIVFDSGVRRGSHVFKALANGADIVGIGRPILYGLYLGGAKGVTSIFEHLNTELSITMQLAGTKTVEDIKRVSLFPMSSPQG